MHLHRERDKLATVSDLGAAYRLLGGDDGGDARETAPAVSASEEVPSRRPMPLGDATEESRLELYHKWRDIMESSVFVMNQAGYDRSEIKAYCRCSDADIDAILNPTLPIFEDWSPISDELGQHAVEWCIRDAERVVNQFKSHTAMIAGYRARKDGFPESVATACDVIAEYHHAQTRLGRKEKWFAELADVDDPFLVAALVYLAGELARIAHGTCTRDDWCGDSIAEKWAFYRDLAVWAKQVGPEEFSELVGNRLMFAIVRLIEEERAKAT